VIAVRLDENIFQKYYARYLDSQELGGSGVGGVTQHTFAFSKVTKRCLERIAVKQQIDRSQKLVSLQGKLAKVDDVIILDDDDDVDEATVIKSRENVDVISIGLTSDDDSDLDYSNEDDDMNDGDECLISDKDDNNDHNDDEDKANADSLNDGDDQEVWDDGEVVYTVNNKEESDVNLNSEEKCMSRKSSVCSDLYNEERRGATSRKSSVYSDISDAERRATSRKSSVCSDISIEDVKPLDDDVDSVENNSGIASATGSVGVYPLRLSSMVPSPVPSPMSPSPVPSPSSSPPSKENDEYEQDPSDVNMQKIQEVMEIDGETIIILNEDSD